MCAIVYCFFNRNMTCHLFIGGVKKALYAAPDRRFSLSHISNRLSFFFFLLIVSGCISKQALLDHILFILSFSWEGLNLGHSTIFFSFSFFGISIPQYSTHLLTLILMAYRYLRFVYTTVSSTQTNMKSKDIKIYILGT